MTAQAAARAAAGMSLTPLARRVIDHAVALAAARQRSCPTGEELMTAILNVGRDEEALGATLSALDFDTMAASLYLLSEAANRADGDLPDQTWAGFLAGLRLLDLPRIDCLALAESLLASPHISADARAYLADRGLDRRLLLEWPGGVRIAALAPDPAAAKRQPPIGALIDPATVPAPIGRGRLAASLAARFAAGESLLLSGAQGVGKSVLARYTAAASGRASVSLTRADLFGAGPDRDDRVRELGAWLRQRRGGLVLVDADPAWTGDIALPPSVPVLSTCSGRKPPVRLSPPRPSARITVRPLSRPRDMAGAVAAWMRQPGNPCADADTIPYAIDLATRFLGGEESLPGAVTTLMRFARDRAADGEAPLTRESLAEAAAYRANLPPALVCPGRLAKLRSMPDRLGARVVGQRPAITAVSDAIARREVAFGERSRPVGVFLFIGPTGVGKTELARALAADYIGADTDLVRFDMGEYKERHEVSRLAGAPPSYIGHDQPGQLLAAFGFTATIDQARRKPGEPPFGEQTRKRAVVLFDEIEKAHPAIYDMLLGVLDTGIVTGARGEKVDLRDSVIVMTSNIGVREADDAGARRGIGFGSGTGSAADSSAARAKAVRERFAPEFINRIDAVVEFSDLTRAELHEILDHKIAAYAARLGDAGLRLSVGPSVRDRMVGDAVASRMGARELVLRSFAREIEDRVTRAMLDGRYWRGAVIEIEDCGGAGDTVVRLPDGRTA
jgi:MoxR-like ATPase